ncbi:MAG: Fic family protein [Desulfatirhabdiaceae bacterium]
MLIEGDVFRMIIRVPEFGADISSQTSVGQDTPPVTPPVTTPVTPPVNMYVRRLLELLESSGSLGNAEILTAFKLKDRRRLRETYIAPALGSGVIAYTIPEKPRSSNQKYRLTEKGRKLLEILS